MTTRQITLTIEEPGTLQSILLRQDVTPAQVSMVRALLGSPDITYGEFLEWLRERDIVSKLTADSNDYIEWLAQHPGNN